MGGRILELPTAQPLSNGIDVLGCRHKVSVLFPKTVRFSVLIKVVSEFIERVPNLRATLYALPVCCFDKPVPHGADQLLRIVPVVFNVNAGQIRKCTPIVKLTRFKNQAALSLQARWAKELRASINPQFERKIEAREQIVRGCFDA